MENKRLKSAWEIALERAEKLGELSPEEVRAGEEAKYAPIGQSLAARYLSELSLRDFQFLLDKYEGQARRIVERAAALALVDALDLDDTGATQRAMEALQVLIPELRLADLADGARRIAEDYRRTMAERLAEHATMLGNKVAHRLQDLGIAGSAVRVNPASASEWQGLIDQVKSDFASQLATLKRALRSRITAPGQQVS